MNKINENECCGCMACMNVCPQMAIFVKEDNCGFIYPYVDLEKCTHCGLCDSVCDFRKEKIHDSTIRAAYALQHNNKEVLKNSTSGGAFTAVSDIILEHGGVVVGAVMESDFSVRHEIAYSKEERDKMRGSIYVQSNTNTIFKQINKILEQDKYVVFVGTPCQCAGLRSYLRKNHSKLFVVDFLCHGTPNNRLFKEHIHYLEKIEKKKAIDYIFRDKKFGWSSPGISGIRFSSGRFKYRKHTQAFYYLFLNNVSLRPSCFNCKYRSYHRYSDLTIGDFWGLDKVVGEIDRKGTSVVLVNSDKGANLISLMKDNVSLVEVQVKKIIYRVSAKPAISKSDIDEFWKMYREKGYIAIVRRYTDNSLKSYARFALRKLKRKILR